MSKNSTTTTYRVDNERQIKYVYKKFARNDKNYPVCQLSYPTGEEDLSTAPLRSSGGNGLQDSGKTGPLVALQLSLWFSSVTRQDNDEHESRHCQSCEADCETYQRSGIERSVTEAHEEQPERPDGE